VIGRVWKRWENLWRFSISTASRGREGEEDRDWTHHHPPFRGQNVANQLVEAEVKGFSTFAPAQVTVPDGYMVKDVFFTTILDNLAYLLSNN